MDDTVSDAGTFTAWLLDNLGKATIFGLIMVGIVAFIRGWIDAGK